MRIVFQSPARFGVFAGCAFFLVAELILLFPAFRSGADVVQMSAADTIALMTGTITAGGLAAVYFQVVEAGRSARERADEIQRQSALHLDALHVTFNSMRNDRNLAYVYLKLLYSKPSVMDEYARYWIADVGFCPPIPNVGDIRKLFEQAEVTGEVTTYDFAANRDFHEYDMAISAMVAFFVRLSVHLQGMHGRHHRFDPTDEIVKEAISPFFWSSYWGPLLLPLTEACERAHSTSDKFEKPYFAEPLKRLDAFVH